MKTVNKTYEASVKTSNGSDVYIVMENKGIAINTQNNEQITFQELTKMMNKKQNEFSSDWERTPNTGIAEFMEQEMIENILIDDDSESIFKNVKYRYEIVIAQKDDELYMIRELVGKWDLITGEDIFQPFNDNNGSWTNTSYKVGLTNSLIWYANELGKLDSLLEYLGFENLGTTWIKDSILVVPNRDHTGYMLKRVEPQQHTQARTKQSRQRGGTL